GTLLDQPGRPALRTEEGAAAVREAIAVLRRTPGMGRLRWSRGLSAGARDHVHDQGPTGGMGHHGHDRSTPAARVNRYGRWRRGLAENISYGEGDAGDVVMQLLIDDGVPGRGHRTTLLYPDYHVAGVSCGPHASYRQMCVIDCAIRYEERN
ncbi:MAG: CAP domain-containing protein, partial [Gemmatimonadales bacterium]